MDYRQNSKYLSSNLNYEETSHSISYCQVNTTRVIPAVTLSQIFLRRLGFPCIIEKNYQFRFVNNYRDFVYSAIARSSIEKLRRTEKLAFCATDETK